MSSLPPYSTYRTNKTQMMYPQAVSHGNVLTFTPPGFKQTLNVKFPDSRLAVCEKCKKNYKTRDMCRVRNAHTTAPWTTAFICITLDASCTNADGKYIDKPLTVRMVPWSPYCVKTDFDSKTPVCAACKKTNRTRSFCRNRHKHRQLPWCTVYVILSALEATDPSTVVAAPSRPLSSTESNENNNSEVENESSAVDDSSKENPSTGTMRVYPDETVKDKEVSQKEEAEDKKEEPKDEKDLVDIKKEKVDDKNEKMIKKESNDDDKSEVDAGAKDVNTERTEELKDAENSSLHKTIEKSLESSESGSKKDVEMKLESEESTEEDSMPAEDINDIYESRTFLVKVSCRKTSVHWLDLSEHEPNNTSLRQVTNAESQVKELNNAIRNPTLTMPVAVDPSQYYAQMNALASYPQMQQQQALQMQQQQFLLQQTHQQQFAAQAAWQAQYNQQIMQMNGQVVAPATFVPAVPLVAPGVAPLPIATATPTPATAGEAAAAKQKENGETVSKSSNTATPTVAMTPTPGAVAFPTQQTQAWQAHMMYQQQQLYHQQLMAQQQMSAAQQQQMLAVQQQMMAAAGGVGQTVPSAAAATVKNDGGTIGSSTDGNKDGGDAKRQRVS